MSWILDRLGRMRRRISAHRGEAAVVFGFVLSLSTVLRVLGLAPRTAQMLNAHAAFGLPAAVALAMTLAWLPLMVIDMKRCTRETALRKHVQADLEQRQRVEQLEQQARAHIRARVGAVLDVGGPRIVYQPIIDMCSRRFVGYEALSRFEDGVNPAEWFASASTVGLGVELELAAIYRALEALPILPAECYLSVNAGVAPLLDPRLHARLDQSDLGRIVVELTEHCAVVDYEECRLALSDLRSRGLRLAVDDAGAGYASLRHIVDLAPDVIKVDRALVQGIDADPLRRSLFIALVTFAADMGASLVAEGVETADEASRLAEWGVRLAQGWHFGRPAPLPLSGQPSVDQTVEPLIA